jgi:hypothetical protein
MSHPTHGTGKRKAVEAGMEDRPRQKVSRADWNEIVDSVSDFVQQQYDQNAENVRMTSQEVSEWSQEEFELHIAPDLWDESNFSGSTSPESSFTPGFTSLEFGLTEPLDKSRRTLGDSFGPEAATATTTTTTFTDGASQKDEDVAMSSSQFEGVNYAKSLPRGTEEDVEEMFVAETDEELDEDGLPDYTRREAPDIFNSQEDKDVAMSSSQFEGVNYAKSLSQETEEDVEEVFAAETDEELDEDDLPEYTRREALNIFNQAWAELLRSVADKDVDESLLEIETPNLYDEAKAECLSRIEEFIADKVSTDL